MPTIIGPIGPDGAFVRVTVGLSLPGVQALRAALRPVPAPVVTRAILDTGAEMTCVDTALVQHFHLLYANTAIANLPAHGGLRLAPQSYATLTILHPSGGPRENLVLPNHEVLEVSLAGIGYDVLIGRDVLSRCRLLYNGPRNRFRLAY